MRNFLDELFHSVRSNNKLYEAFISLSQGGGVPSETQKSLLAKSPFLVLLSFIIIEVIVLCFGKWLWNNVVIQLVSGIKPAKTIWQILGLSILIKLMTN